MAGGGSPTSHPAKSPPHFEQASLEPRQTASLSSLQDGALISARGHGPVQMQCGKGVSSEEFRSVEAGTELMLRNGRAALRLADLGASDTDSVDGSSVEPVHWPLQAGRGMGSAPAAMQECAREVAALQLALSAKVAELCALGQSASLAEDMQLADDLGIELPRPHTVAVRRHNRQRSGDAGSGGSSLALTPSAASGGAGAGAAAAFGATDQRLPRHGPDAALSRSAPAPGGIATAPTWV